MMASAIWTCPKCGRNFRQKNMYHSCEGYPLEHHFKTASPRVCETYETLYASLQELGSVTAHPVKTRIIFQAELQFAAVVVHRSWLEVWVWLRRSAHHPRLLRVEIGVFRDYGHVFRLEREDDIDQEFLGLLREAYAFSLG